MTQGWGCLVPTFSGHAKSLGTRRPRPWAICQPAVRNFSFTDEVPVILPMEVATPRTSLFAIAISGSRPSPAGINSLSGRDQANGMHFRERRPENRVPLQGIGPRVAQGFPEACKQAGQQPRNPLLL